MAEVNDDEFQEELRIEVDLEEAEEEEDWDFSLASPPSPIVHWRQLHFLSIMLTMLDFLKHWNYAHYATFLILGPIMPVFYAGIMCWPLPAINGMPHQRKKATSQPTTVACPILLLKY